MGNIALQWGDANTALDQFRTYLKLAPQGSLAPQVKATISELEKDLEQDQIQALAARTNRLSATSLWSTHPGAHHHPLLRQKIFVSQMRVPG